MEIVDLSLTIRPSVSWFPFRSQRSHTCFTLMVSFYFIRNSNRREGFKHSTPSLLFRTSKEERRKLCHITYQGQVTSCLFTNNNYLLIPLIWEEGGFRSGNFKSTFPNFYCILLKVNDVLCDRRMIKSQKTTVAMTPVLRGRGSSQYSLVCKITRTSLEKIVPHQLQANYRISFQFI